MPRNASKMNAWSEFGYAVPHRGGELRVAEIASTYESLSSGGLKKVRKELKKLIQGGKLRIGYQDWANRLRLRIKNFVPSNEGKLAGAKHRLPTA